MNPTKYIRRFAAALAGLAAALLAFAGAAPAALARPAPPRPPDWNNHPHLPYGHETYTLYNGPAHTVVIGGMPGWQIALIAIGAALAAAAVAVLVNRAQMTRKTHATTA